MPLPPQPSPVMAARLPPDASTGPACAARAAPGHSLLLTPTPTPTLPFTLTLPLALALPFTLAQDPEGQVAHAAVTAVPRSRYAYRGSTPPRAASRHLRGGTSPAPCNAGDRSRRSPAAEGPDITSPPSHGPSRPAPRAAPRRAWRTGSRCATAIHPVAQPLLTPSPPSPAGRRTPDVLAGHAQHVPAHLTPDQHCAPTRESIHADQAGHATGQHLAPAASLHHAPDLHLCPGTHSSPAPSPKTCTAPWTPTSRNARPDTGAA